MSDRREDLDDAEESTLTALQGLQSKMWTSLPGVVTRVDLVKQTVEVQPTIQGVMTDRNNEASNVNMPILADVPIVWPRAGGFALTFPVKVGDEVLVVFASRAIDSWWQSGGIGPQIEARMHDLSDGFAILAPTSQPKKLPNVKASAVQLRNESGNAYIEITEDGDINLVSPRDVKLTSSRDMTEVVGRNSSRTATGTATTSATGLVTLNSSSGLNFGTAGGSAPPVTISSGNITWNATAFNLAGGGLTHNGKNVGATHTHGGVQPGSGTSGVPS